MKKLLAVVVALVLVLSLTAAVAEDIREIELGTSGIVMTVPVDYVPGEITAEDTDENQVAYYRSEAALMDFDVYQWAKADGETLESAIAEEAAEYDAEAVAAVVNGIPMMYYVATEEFEGQKFYTMTFLMESGDLFVELVFWMDGADASYIVTDIINTITVKEAAEISDGGTEIILGTSRLKITTPVVYVKGEMNAEDTDENQVAYYRSDASLVDFDVYQWTRVEGETSESVANEEAVEYGSDDVAEIIVNDIVAYGYYAEEEFEGVAYRTFTLITEDGDDFVELVFWLDGEGDEPALFMTSIVATLTRF